MIGIGLMKKHLVLYNRGIRNEYLIKGISKMKGDEVKKVFKERLTLLTVGSMEGGQKVTYEYYIPNTSNFDIPYDFKKFRDFMKPKEKVKKTVSKEVSKVVSKPKNVAVQKPVEKPVEKPIKKRKITIITKEERLARDKKPVVVQDTPNQKIRKLNQQVLTKLKEPKNNDLLISVRDIKDKKKIVNLKKLYKSVFEPAVKKYKQILDDGNISTRGFRAKYTNIMGDIISSLKKNPNFVLKYKD